LNVPHNSTEFTRNDDIRSCQDNPAGIIEQAFLQVQQEQMQELPFLNDKLAVKAVGFNLFEGDWLGVLLTPWTLSLILLPGPDRQWQPLKVGDKVGLKLPAGDYPFTYGWHAKLGNYLACSVQSPLQDMPSQEEALRVAQDISRLVTAIPSRDIEDSSRRGLFNRLVKGQPAIASE
jgi:[NiFe] hydrogenase assembly HybE family chaperone